MTKLDEAVSHVRPEDSDPGAKEGTPESPRAGKNVPSGARLRVDAVELTLFKPECERNASSVAAQYGFSKDDVNQWVAEYITAGRRAGLSRWARFRLHWAALSLLPLSGFAWAAATWYLEKYDAISRTGMVITAEKLDSAWNASLKKCISSYRIDVENKSSGQRKLSRAAVRLDKIPLAYLGESGVLLDYSKGRQQVFDWRAVPPGHPLLVANYEPGAHSWYTFDLAVEPDNANIYVVSFEMSDDRGRADKANWAFASCGPNDGIVDRLEH